MFPGSDVWRFRRIATLARRFAVLASIAGAGGSWPGWAVLRMPSSNGSANNALCMLARASRRKRRRELRDRRREGAAPQAIARAVGRSVRRSVERSGGRTVGRGRSGSRSKDAQKSWRGASQATTCLKIGRETLCSDLASGRRLKSRSEVAQKLRAGMRQASNLGNGLDKVVASSAKSAPRPPPIWSRIGQVRAKAAGRHAEFGKSSQLA